MLDANLEIRYVPSENQITDVMMKPLSGDKFLVMQSQLNVQHRQLRLMGDISNITNITMHDQRLYNMQRCKATLSVIPPQFAQPTMHNSVP